MQCPWGNEKENLNFVHCTLKITKFNRRFPPIGYGQVSSILGSNVRCLNFPVENRLGIWHFNLTRDLLNYYFNFVLIFKFNQDSLEICVAISYYYILNVIFVLFFVFGIEIPKVQMIIRQFLQLFRMLIIVFSLKFAVKVGIRN